MDCIDTAIDACLITLCGYDENDIYEDHTDYSTIENTLDKKTNLVSKEPKRQPTIEQRPILRQTQSTPLLHTEYSAYSINHEKKVKTVKRIKKIKKIKWILGNDVINDKNE
jgi:hypothetical protein